MIDVIIVLVVPQDPDKDVNEIILHLVLASIGIVPIFAKIDKD